MADGNLTKLAWAVDVALAEMAGNGVEVQDLPEIGLVEAVKDLGRELGLDMEDNGGDGDDINPGFRVASFLHASLGFASDAEPQPGESTMALAEQSFRDNVGHYLGIDFSKPYDEMKEEVGELAAKLVDAAEGGDAGSDKRDMLIGALLTAMARMVEGGVEVQDLNSLDYTEKIGALAEELGVDRTGVVEAFCGALASYEPDHPFNPGLAYEISNKMNIRFGFELPETYGEMNAKYGELAGKLVLD